ncbi:MULTISPECIES: MBL fold metallo-hydrolase [unclassified Mesorhizobium]|uniref:MBL fold metallo-hydrolase n=1 Tax=unclassified Mesorhizobium TaxID=325217 RepID=UPI00112850B1|nr:MULTISPECIES: MBL fold metallo-hydrolase [unclassified Mesorhizobium]TPK62568.1 MBL fold metallo-hydrolase [Mesorhizobium sp. B2-5-1]TPM59707.1 MBL fold metallo-hydrolase [Mesorhizobium sp. B2-1-9]TPM85592.1 MBL fold metallo-hydrolase [Mesorhizobium sp. B2-1-4]TPN10050.1 MBL fold metallo-hydrolase [Mesorhizobium sp. B2-1-2]UCI16498.1 MBL fold metallo-hydrolase [Mesorhizobium sp. B2-1-1]
MQGARGTDPILRFHGAAHGVTGSCYEIETSRWRVLVDCGLFQGSKSERELNYGQFPFPPETIDAVILTHAHIDHSGLLAKLVKEGFSGPIHSTRATIDLCSVMLPDAAHIQEMEVEQLNRRNARRGRPLVEPIYTLSDAAACMTLFRALEYGEWTTVAEGLRARFWNAGHLLGSASVELEIDLDHQKRPMRILFSGDIGPGHKLLQTGPEGPAGVDYLICESTYGDRERPDVSPEQRRSQLGDIVRGAAETGGPLIIPSFAVERTQELLVDLHLLMRTGAVPSAPVFVDSPLATRASAIFERHADEIEQGDALRQALNSKELRFTETVEQSKAINRLTGFFVVIAASGMCDAGRIRHHLKANLWRRNATVMIAGYQAQGSLGRILLDGARRVRIQGEEVEVKAHVSLFDLYSGHADAAELVAWVASRGPVRQAVFLTHGEEEGLRGFSERLQSIMPDGRIITPRLDDAFQLTFSGSLPVELNQPRRLRPESVARLDWHNDLSRLLLDINEAVGAAADERGRAAVIRRMRRALDGNDA